MAKLLHSLPEYGKVDMATVHAAFTRSVNVDMDDQACTEALADLDAYYKVSTCSPFSWGYFTDDLRLQ